MGLLEDWLPVLNKASAVFMCAVAVLLLLIALSHLLAARAHGNIPTLVGHVPFLGVAASIAAEGVSYLTRVQRKYGAIVRLLLGGSHRIFLLDAGDFRQVFSRPHSFDFGRVMYTYTSRLTSISVSRLETVRPSDSKSYKDHFLRYLQGAALATRNKDLAAQLMSSVIRPAASTSPSSKPHWTTVGALQWTNDLLFDAGVFLIFGPGFDVGAVRQPLRDFDSAVPMLLALPPFLARFIIPRAFAARTAMADAIEKYYITCGIGRPGFVGATSPLSGLMQERYYDLTAAGFTVRELACINVTIMWALHTNTAPTLFWLLAHVVADRSAYAAVRAEVDALGPHWWTDGAQLSQRLDSCAALTSATWETLRLTAGTASMREVMQPAEITVTAACTKQHDATTRKVALSPGEQVILLPAHHYDDRVFPDAKAFVFDRFLPASDGTEKTFVLPSGVPLRHPVQPFGGGDTMCPGRFLALNEVRLFVGLVLYFFDAEPAPIEGGGGSAPTPLPPMDVSRTGVGVYLPTSEWPMRLRFREGREAELAEEGEVAVTDSR